MILAASFALRAINSIAISSPKASIFKSNRYCLFREFRTGPGRYMAKKSNGGAPPAEGNGSAPGPRKLKILMLHGYTQSGPLFHAKTRALEKLLIKAFPATPISPLHKSHPGGIQLFYPTGPHRLRPADIPGYTPKELDGEETDSWGWWIREAGSGLYGGLNEGLGVIRTTIIEAGGIDGVIGFSQGAAAAVFVASMLEPGRQKIFQALEGKSPDAFTFPENWADVLDIQASNGHTEGLKFAVSYSGFYAPHEAYKGFYEPKVKTPVLSVVGSLDSVVEEERSVGLSERCDEETRKMVYHPGGHFVPIHKEMAGMLIGFIREVCMEKTVEDSVEDMDMPF